MNLVNLRGIPKLLQLDNHLGSAAEILYEEYHPYGSTSYRASPSGVEVSARRYRYTGKERDEETGLYYYGARYYAACEDVRVHRNYQPLATLIAEWQQAAQARWEARDGQ